MSVEAFNVEDEFRRIVAEGRISEESLHAITGIPGDAIASLLDATQQREPGLSAPPPAFLSDEIGRLSALVGQLTEGLQIDDDVRLTAIIQTLTVQFRRTHQHIALLTGIDLNDLEGILNDPNTVPAERKYQLAIRASYLRRILQWYAITYYLQEAIMSAITATEARKSLFSLIQQVNDDHTAVEVVSRHGNAVILSKEDYDAMTETAYLLRNPANAERLLAAIERARRGEFEQHDLLDE